MRRKQTKRLLSLLLSLVMMLSLASAALAAGPFTDVPAGAWYAKDVESAVANGLVNGTSATTFSPDKNLTYAEAVKLAAAMHKKMTTGTADFAVGTPWYQTYVDYAITSFPATTTGRQTPPAPAIWRSLQTRSPEPACSAVIRRSVRSTGSMTTPFPTSR